ncbi:hypothetical protein [Nitrosopumilus sp.]|uniref:hypothetical protein n=1 Tax=Nitrosopumilus sp. TaxID=2024843 RepID=UPI003D1342E7
MKKIFFVIIGIITVIATVLAFSFQPQPGDDSSSFQPQPGDDSSSFQPQPGDETTKLNSALQSAQIEFDKLQNSDSIVFSPDTSGLFHVYAFKNHFYENSEGVLETAIQNFILKPELQDTYLEIGLFDDPQNTVVIIPIFTANAYKPSGFYEYYDGRCNSDCLTVSIENVSSGFSSSDNGRKILGLLQYEMLTDIQVDDDPEILKNYDKVILLHNEYVTKKMFDAITDHPNVIYLYPNALYAEINRNVDDNTMTLIRGHNYPEKEILNGFDWEFENTHPYEYDTECTNWEFYEISNGWMLNCYPENVLEREPLLLKQLKDF